MPLALAYLQLELREGRRGPHDGAIAEPESGIHAGCHRRATTSVTAPRGVIFDVDGTLVDTVYFHSKPLRDLTT